MATLIGDYGPSHSGGFHNMISTPGLPYSQTHPDPALYRSRSASHSRDATSRRQSLTRQKSSPRYPKHEQKETGRGRAFAVVTPERETVGRLPTPPESGSSPSSCAEPASRSGDKLSAEDQSVSRSQHGIIRSKMDSAMPQSARASPDAPPIVPTHAALVNSLGPAPHDMDDDERWNPPGRLACEPPAGQTTVHIRDLAHVQTLADTMRASSAADDVPLQTMKYEISGMPISDIIEMVAALLTKITTTNDLHDDALSRNAVQRNASHVKQAQAQNDGSATESSVSPHSSSVLAFHGKNVPAITILSYLSRIHKYCPTTYEVFLSLLVYFDRMTERVNNMVLKAEKLKETSQPSEPRRAEDEVMNDDNSSDSEDQTEDHADDDSDCADEPIPGPSDAKSKATKATVPPTVQPTFFVVDSFNIHRLIIAGVTCSSKFFSDVFYTNSRYAKVGGLPLAELNHLEIQFLILNDFRLAVPVEDLEAYATMLVEFYAREVVGQGA